MAMDRDNLAARYQAILDTAVDAIFTISKRGICESLNRSAEVMFGYKANEIVGQNISRLMPSPFSEEHDGYLQNYLTTGEKKIIGIGREAVGLRKDGSIFPTYISVSEVQIDNQLFFTGIIQDISERKSAEQQLVQNERLAAIGEAMSRLAHESRNSLQRIQIGVETARLDLADEKSVSEQLELIEHVSDGMSALLEEIRNYAAPIQLHLEKIDLAKTWRDAWNSIEATGCLRDVRIVEQVEPDSLQISADRFRLGQVFRNLFENSLAACADPVEIAISVTKSHTSSGPTLCISYTDNGPGLTVEQEERVFQPFYTTKTKGTGLGMSIAERIVNAHGGTLALSKSVGRGAAFHIELPQQLV